MGNASSSEKEEHESGEFLDHYLPVATTTTTNTKPLAPATRSQRRSESVSVSSYAAAKPPQFGPSRSSSVSHPHPPTTTALRPSATQFRPPDSVALAPVLSTHNSTSSASIMGQAQSRHGAAGGAHAGSASPAKPVNIPDSRKSSHSQAHRPPSEAPFPVPIVPIVPIGLAPGDEPESYLIADPEYTRPPRLPLPINAQKLSLGDPLTLSPVLSPLIPPAADSDDTDSIPPIDLKPAEEQGILTSLPSAVSTAPDDDDDDDDIGDDLGTVRGGVLPPVPTVIEWVDRGSKVYVTGTFADWDRKYRLTRNGPSKKRDVLSTTINLQPGTYHLRFIVDGDMILSKHLPTAVDFTNSLVNYIEVMPKETTATAGPQSLVPAELQNQAAAPPHVIDMQPGAPSAAIAVPAAQDSRPPTLPPTPSIGPVSRASPIPPASETPSSRTEMRKPPIRYTSVIPPFLKDADASDTTQEFRRSLALGESLPSPPSQPMFLNKSILNGNTPMKDDASVLILPNHTVLNHLATTSVRNGVLATSATTRYKRKFLTTIMYKPRDAAA